MTKHNYSKQKRERETCTMHQRHGTAIITQECQQCLFINSICFLSPPACFFFWGEKPQWINWEINFWWLTCCLHDSLRGKRQIILRILKSFWLQVWISDIMANYDIPYAPVRQVGRQKQKKLFMYFNQSYFFPHYPLNFYSLKILCSNQSLST